jgi:protein ImuB
VEGGRYQAQTPLQYAAHDPPPRPGEDLEGRIAECSTPRGGGWRPGARWAKQEPPPHQRPNIREMGRRTEAAEPVFKSSPSPDGEGDHPKGGGGVTGTGRATYPSTPLRGVPLPISDGEELPLATTHRAGNRVTLAAVSTEAAALGLAPGMAVTHARALVPSLDLADADPEGDYALLHSLALFAARRWTPHAAVSGPDGLWLDLDGVAHLFGGEEAMCRRILAFCARAGFAARIAVAGTPGAAHALARFGPRPLILCPAGGEAETLAPLPIAALRVEETALATARRLGLERIGDLLPLPRAPLGRRFGKAVLARLDQALGREREPFEPVVPEAPPAAELRFAEPIATAEALTAALAELIRRLIQTLSAAGLGARRLALLSLRVDGDVQRLVIGTVRASRDGRHLERLLAPKLETIEPGFGIEAMRLIAERTDQLGAKAIDGALAGEAPEPDIAPLVDRLAGRIGPRRLFATGAVESDVPERSVRRLPPLSPAPAWPRWPRPVRLLSPPERVDNVVALLPDQPPRRFTWRGRLYSVRQADGPERIHGEWWRRSEEAEAVRDYFQVEDEAGARFWLYRRGDGLDPRTGDLSWYLHGVFG